MGLRGEVEETLSYLKTRGTTLVLGLREVMDAPHLLDAEWKRNDVMRKIGQFYDMIWVYGPPDFYDPLTGLDVPAGCARKMKFVGFLQRSLSHDEAPGHRAGGRLHSGHHRRRRRRRRSDPQRASMPTSRTRPHHRALIVLGPYMPAKKRRKLIAQGRERSRSSRSSSSTIAWRS